MIRKIKLTDILQALPQKEVIAAGALDVELRDVVYDSRHSKKGAIFVAVVGFHTDGHRFIEGAAKRGAVAIVGSDGDKLRQFVASPQYANQCVVRVEDTRVALAQLAAIWQSYPAREMGVIGITGTDGKTTTSFMVTAILEQARLVSGLIGTVEFKIGSKRWAHGEHQTTPEAPEIQELLRQMAKARVQYAVMEATSHGLALHRVDECAFDIAVLTNLTRDHLEFHGTLENYRSAKGLLFEALSQEVPKPFLKFPKTAIVNQDDPNAPFFISRALENAVAKGHEVRVMSYAINSTADVTAYDIQRGATGLHYRAVTPQGEFEVALQLPGDFNIYNSLAAICVGLTLQLDTEVIRQGLANLAGVPGRMETIQEGQPFAVIVDFAHTPDALTKVMTVLRPLTPGKLIVVFGCAGERDTTKRPLMGYAVATLADFSIFTNEDPRQEDAAQILNEIASGAESAGWQEGQNFLKLVDRRSAIEAAFARAKTGDTVLLAGKGHEQSIIIGTEATPWDEREEARQALRRVMSNALKLLYIGCLLVISSL